ncbi:hypothetical protein CRG98_029256, partial [Punica granatum]
MPYISIGDDENLPFHSFETISVIRDYGESGPSRADRMIGKQLGEPQPVYFGEGLPEDGQVPEIEGSLRRLEDHQITSVEPTEEINVGTEGEPRTLKIGTALDPTHRTRMIDFLKEYQEGILQVDDEGEKPKWKMYFDGAVNSTGSGIGAVLISPDGRYYPVAAKIDFSCTNNVAEYEACILGLQAAIDFKVRELEVFGDSMLIIFQTLGQWKTKDAKLVPYHEYLERLTENFENISFTYTPRMKNQFADALATLASMVSITRENLIQLFEIEIAEGPAHCNAIEAFEAKP